MFCTVSLQHAFASLYIEPFKKRRIDIDINALPALKLSGKERPKQERY
jgi:hypothetical protein